MDLDSSQQLIIASITVLLIILSAIITLSEVSFVTLTKGKIRNMVDDEVKNAKILSDLLENNYVFNTLTISNSFVNVAATVLGSFLFTSNLNVDNYILRLGISILIMTFVILVFGELIPETMARNKPEKIGLRYVSFARIVVILLRPMVVLFYGFSGLILRILGFRNKKEPSVTMEEFRSIVDASVEEGVLDIQEKEIIDNITEFGELRVDDVMTQRTDMVTLNCYSSYDEVKNVIIEEKYSRIPVYRDSIDDIVGILNVKDLMFVDFNENFNICDYVRDAYFTYEFKLVQDLFREMRKNKTHMSIVLDEYGGTVGLVTIEDFLEEIVGEIDDEFDDDEEPEMVKLGENEYYFAGTYKLDDLNEELGTRIESDDVDTIGGFIINLLGNFPENKQVIDYQNLRFVVDFSKNRITGVKVTVRDEDSLESDQT